MAERLASLEVAEEVRAERRAETRHAESSVTAPPIPEPPPLDPDRKLRNTSFS